MRLGPSAALVALFFVAACGGAQTPASTTPSPSVPEAAPTPVAPEAAASDDTVGRAPNSVERSAVQRLIDETVATRHLEPTRPITIRVARAQQIATRLAGQIEPEDVEHARAEYTALGLLPPQLDLRTLLKDLLAEQVVGFYDPERDDLVIRDDAARGLTRIGLSPEPLEGRAALAHEIVHALQDQRLGLGEAMHLDRDTDAEDALHSLVEGDATLAMVGWLLARAGQPLEDLTQDPGRMRGLRQMAAPSGERLLAAPRIVQVSLLAPYLEGLNFCAVLHARGGFAAIDAAHAHPPRSMEQVLHPQKYLAGEEPETIALPPLPSLEAAGFHPLLDDTLGELEMGVYLGLGQESGVDEAAAAGWGGDRLRIYQGPRELAAVWLSTWDDEDEARGAEQAARRAQGTSSVEEQDSERVLRIGRALMILRGVPAEQQAGVVAALEGIMRQRSRPAAPAPTPRSLATSFPR